MPSATAKPVADIPVIDISTTNADAANAILDAACKFGFVFIENNDAAEMPAEDVAKMFEMSKEFFHSPVEVKESCSINSSTSGKNKGWLSMHTETLDPKKQKRGDFKEAFNIGEIRSGLFTQPLPPPFSTHAPTLATFAQRCHALCSRLLSLFELALDVPAGWFTGRHDQSLGASGSILRLLYYPSVPAEQVVGEDDIRAGAHSDYGSLTLLFQLPGQPGLEILTPAGEWAAVPVDPAGTLAAAERPGKALPILVNIGDLLSYWTNGLLKSTVHRVIFPRGEAGREGADRYSMAYFCHPCDEAELVAVPSEKVRRDGTGVMVEGGRVLTARDHLNERLAATYGLKG